MIDYGPILFGGKAPAATAATPTPLPAVTKTTLPPNAPTPFPTPPSTPTATPYRPPQFPPEAVIQLLGPPPGSLLPASRPVTFYWRWPLPLEEDQELALYLLQDGEEQRLGALSEPNLGALYQLQASPSSPGDAAVNLQWQVRLETTLAPDPLAVSERRPLLLAAR